MPTLSEQHFENFCNSKGIRWNRILESEIRMADYKIWLGESLIFAEVKQLDLNEADKELIKALQEGTKIPSGFRATGHIRVRNAIDNAYQQLKNAANERYPAILIVYDNTLGFSHLGHDDILNAMYGDESVTVNWSEQERTESGILAHRFGGNRRVTHNSYRALSGIGLLEFDEINTKLTLTLFHNIHARHPLESKLVWYFADRQFIVADTENYQNWTEIAKGGTHRLTAESK